MFYYKLQLSDGFKSIYSKIFPSNPIFHLIKKDLILPGLKLSIGISKLEGEIIEDQDLFIQLQYNTVSRAANTVKLGICKNPYQIRSIYSLREDGGDISMIDVIILKKCNFYYFDVLNKKRMTVEKFDKLYGGGDDEGTAKKFTEKKVILNFKVIAADSLNLYDFLVKNKKAKNFEIKKSVEKASRKCIIEFGNSEDVYHNITVGI
jgi:hypothetical protein